MLGAVLFVLGLALVVAAVTGLTGLWGGLLAAGLSCVLVAWLDARGADGDRS